MERTVKEQLLEDKRKLEKERLGKKLTYLLRYGAEKERLNVTDQGFVDIEELATVELLSGYSLSEIRREIESSFSLRNTKRFETFESPDGKLLVRAAHSRRMERNPYHDQSKVKRLLFLSVDTVADNVRQYDFTDFPDDYLLNLIIRRMKRRGCLSNKALRHFMVPSMEHLDLWNVFINEATVKLISKKCPHLLTLSFYNCGYVITDHLLLQILKGIPKLQSLNLHGCRHVTSASLKGIATYCQALKHLNLTFCCQIDQDALLSLIKSIKTLEELNIYDFKGFSEENLVKFQSIVADRSLRFDMAIPLSGTCEEVLDSPWERLNYR